MTGRPSGKLPKALNVKGRIQVVVATLLTVLSGADAASGIPPADFSGLIEDDVPPPPGPFSAFMERLENWLAKLGAARKSN